MVNRSWRLPAWQSFRQRKNPALTWILAAAAALLIVLLTVPALRHAFSFGPMTPLDLLVTLAAGLIGVAWFEAYKTWAHQ